MARIFKLYDGTNTLSMITGQVVVVSQHYIPPVTDIPGDGSDPPSVIEVIPVEVVPTSDDNLATTMQTLDLLRKGAAEYKVDRNQETPVWFHQKLKNETGERRYLVEKVQFEWGRNIYSEAPAVTQSIPATLTVTRKAYAERTATRTFPAAAPSAAISVSYDYTGGGSPHDIVGDAPARIDLFSVAAGNAGDELGRIWIGLRSATRHGTVGNFVNIWELEDTDATLGTDAARATDATASPGGAGDTKVTITPGTATWAKRLTIELRDVTTNESDNYGKFLGLLRSQVSAGTWEIQLRHGSVGMDDDEFVRGPVVELDNTSWDILEMGTYQIPLRNLKTLTTTMLSDFFDSTYAIQFWARRTDGSGTLDLDCLGPIPIDEGFFAAWDMDLAGADGSAGTEQRIAIGESPGGEIDVSGVSAASATVVGRPPFVFDNFRLPVGDGRMIIVYAQDTVSVLADVIEIAQGVASGLTEIYTERWANLRGAE